MVGELDSTLPTTYTGWVIGLAQSSARSVNVRLDCDSVTSTPFNPTFTTRTPGGRFSTEHGTRPLNPFCRCNMQRDGNGFPRLNGKLSGLRRYQHIGRRNHGSELQRRARVRYPDQIVPRHARVPYDLYWRRRALRQRRLDPRKERLRSKFVPPES